VILVLVSHWYCTLPYKSIVTTVQGCPYPSTLQQVCCTMCTGFARTGRRSGTNGGSNPRRPYGRPYGYETQDSTPPSRSRTVLVATPQQLDHLNSNQEVEVGRIFPPYVLRGFEVSGGSDCVAVTPLWV
jgi:hypothetical protein